MLCFSHFASDGKRWVLTEKRVEKAFWWTLLSAACIKSMLAMVVPMTSDEAYFVNWGKNLDFGYYDHPPMIGWILKFALFFGDSRFVLRLPTILSTLLIAIGIYNLLKDRNKTKACMISTLFLVSPFDLLFVLLSTDTPVILFSFLSAAFLFRALESNRNVHFLFSGIFFGLAFLSKYFSVLLGLAYLTYFLFTPGKKERTAGFAILFLSAMPFVCINIYWNYTHCWANLMFNLINRNRDIGFSPVKVLMFMVMQLYLFTPPFTYYLAKKKKEILKSNTEHDGGYRFFAYLFCVPIAVFFLLSFRKTVGMHWVLAFYPFAYLIMFYVLDEMELKKSIKFMMIFSLVHLVLIGTAWSIPLKYVRNYKNYNTIVMGMKPSEMKKALSFFENSFVFSTESYALSAVMSYNYGRYFFVFGGGSYHARQDDIITDFRKLDGKDILILRRSEPVAETYLPYFKKVEVKRFEVENAVFPVILGYGFIYEKYKQDVLEQIRERYYDIPSYFPCRSCYFTERYFP
jgi:hypothetical protein